MSRGPVRSISLFSGVGGLEVPGGPVLACEIDSTCHSVLRRRFQGVEIANDVVHLDPPKADVVTGGWPCQDISVAGLKAGLKGKRSGLFFKMIDIAQTAGAHTVIAENVPNLLKLEDGMHFGLVIEVKGRHLLSEWEAGIGRIKSLESWCTAVSTVSTKPWIFALYPEDQLSKIMDAASG